MQILIDNTIISDESPTYIIAELSANHNHDFDIAIKTIEAAKKAGADAIKLQTYTPDTLTINCKNDHFKIKSGSLWDEKYYYDLYQEAYTPWDWQPKLKQYANDIGITLFSSPFDKTAVDFLEKMDVPAYKIASFEAIDFPFIEYVASKGKPIIISTGISTLSEIQEVINTCKKLNNNQIILLKCTSAYPALPEEMNLKTILNMKDLFKTIVGLSDHSLSNSAAIASVVLGAKVIEKHFILDKSIGGPDAAFSMEPEEFKIMVKSIREVEKALGEVSYELTEKTKKNRYFSRSLFVTEDIKAGETLNENNIRSIRPGIGLHPKFYNKIVGKKAKKDLLKGTPLDWDLIE